jgi:RNA polymerase sigma-B factor
MRYRSSSIRSRSVMQGAMAATRQRTRRSRAQRENFEARYFRRRSAGDPHAREVLVQRYLPLAKTIAQRFRGRGEPMDDLVQVASVALVQAIDRFDPARGTAFSTFAVPTITGELKRYFRDKTRLVRPPRAMYDLRGRIDKAVDALAPDLGRAPTVSELAAYLGTTDELVLEAREATDACRVASLDSVHEDDEPPLAERIPDEEPGFNRVERSATLATLLARLPARERRILCLRYIEELTQTEVGARVGVSQMQVSRLERSALEALQRGAAEMARITPDAKRLRGGAHV